ncbi:VOC family protein [Nocardia sp. NPDC003482]
MSITTTTHLNFRGDARTALEFYRSVFGGDLTVVTYADTGNTAEGDHVLWGQVLADNGFHVMAYDVPATLPYHPGENPVFVSVRGDTVQEITGYWNALSADATVVVPLGPAGWADTYGMLRDRFGVAWVLDVVTPG